MEVNMADKLKPFINIGPGDIIKRNLEALNWSNLDLVEVLGMSEKSISLIINNKQSITVETAFLLGKAFNTSPEFWLTLEQNYRLRNKKEGKKERDTQLKAEIRKFMPVLEMKKKGWIKCESSVETQAIAYKDFWNLAKIDFSPYTLEKKSIVPAKIKEILILHSFIHLLGFKRPKQKHQESKLVGI